MPRINENQAQFGIDDPPMTARSAEAGRVKSHSPAQKAAASVQVVV